VYIIVVKNYLLSNKNMNCSSCIKAKDIFAGIRETDQWCKNKVARMNRILRNFYLDTVDVPSNIVAQPINWSWVVTIQTDYPIYKIFWFFWKAWTCSAQCYIQAWSKCCGDWTDQLKMYHVNLNPWIWQYMSKCDTEVTAWIPQSLQWWYFLYSRWPKEIQSMDDEICLDPRMLTWLEYLIEAFYSESNLEDNKMSIAMQHYNKRLDDVKKATDTFTFSVEFGWTNYNYWF